MVTHLVIIALLAAAPAASPAESAAADESATVTKVAPQRTAQQLRNAIHVAMRRQATAKGAEQEAAVRELTAVFREIQSSTELPGREQRQLRTLVRSRLMRTSKALERQLAKSRAADNKVAPPARDRAAAEPPANRAILAQVRGNRGRRQAAAAAAQGPRRAGGFGPGGQVIGAAGALGAQTGQNAQQLIDLIQSTIAPASWEANGGLGTIRYFAPAQVLVIRQTDGVHGRVGQAIRGLRGN